MALIFPLRLRLSKVGTKMNLAYTHSLTRWGQDKLFSPRPSHSGEILLCRANMLLNFGQKCSATPPPISLPTGSSPLLFVLRCLIVSFENMLLQTVSAKVANSRFNQVKKKFRRNKQARSIAVPMQITILSPHVTNQL